MSRTNGKQLLVSRASSDGSGDNASHSVVMHFKFKLFVSFSDFVFLFVKYFSEQLPKLKKFTKLLEVCKTTELEKQIATYLNGNSTITTEACFTQN